VKRIISLINLAYRFNVHMLKKPFTADLPGRAIFLGQYHDDRLLPLTPEARARLPELQSCISCGLCDTVCTKLDIDLRHLFNGPSDLASCLTRSLPDYDLLKEYLRVWEECGDCRRCEEVCPSGVPLRQLVDFAGAVARDLLEHGED
jgi:succinate dehydrogenase/fumarate reductase-like Fe-S protein